MILGRTGELCDITGKYRCFGNHEVQVCLQQGDFFPKAGDTLNVFWVLSGKTEEEQGSDTAKRYRDRYRS